LAGLDAQRITGLEPVEGQDASGLAFDGRSRLLVGGANDPQGEPRTPAQRWDGRSKQRQVSTEAGAGPVAFRADGRPLQLLARPGPCWVVWDVQGNHQLAECRFDAKPGQPRPLAAARDSLRQAILALSADGTSAAAVAACGPGVPGLVGVWETASGKCLFARQTDASALALSPRGDLLALASKDESISVWSLPAGERLATLPGPRVTVHCLAFSNDAGVTTGQSPNLRGSLAVGDAGGTAHIWDLPRQAPVGLCRGSPYDVYAVAFSPDGTLLATGGRGHVRLYNTATGRFVLHLDFADYVTHLAFAPDGRQLAASSRVDLRRVAVWRLEDGRGLRTLRGLGTQIARVCLSPDGKRLATLAQDWQVGVWDLDTGRLLRLLKARQGVTPDNAALAFSPDGRRLAFCADREARLWDIDQDRIVATWALPRGLIDRMAYDRDGRLLLVRTERKDDPGSGAALDFRRHPWVCRARRLYPPAQAELLFQIDWFNEQIYTAALTPDGQTLVLDGQHNNGTVRQRTIKAFDGNTGSQRWSLPSAKTGQSGSVILDAGGRLLLVDQSSTHDRSELVDLASGKILATLGQVCHGLGPGASYRVRYQDGQPSGPIRGMGLVPPGQARPAITLGPEDCLAFTLVISPDGNRWAWGNTSGTVTVGDLRQINKRLSGVGLGW
jgi:WD40 repeat protein